MAGIWFRIERGPPAGPGVHDYDESGVVWEGNEVTSQLQSCGQKNNSTTGTVTIRDETGHEQTLGPGDSFFIHRGSTVKFSSTGYGVCYKCAARLAAKL
jgi:hypothetical protein